MTVLNTIVAKTLSNFKVEVDALIEKGEKKEIAIMQTLRKYIVDSEKVLFEGDGYSEEWEKEAEKRGLPNVKTTPQALDAFVTPKSTKLFTEVGIYNAKELHARHEILLEDYVKKVQIEARVIGDLATNTILPSAISYLNSLIVNIRGLKEIGLGDGAVKAQTQIAAKIAEHVNVISENVQAMIEARKVANKVTDSRQKAIDYCDKIKPYFDVIRYHADKLEFLVDDKQWALPKYRELLFLR
jgi:glutamine synthetase